MIAASIIRQTDRQTDRQDKSVLSAFSYSHNLIQRIADPESKPGGGALFLRLSE